MADCGAAGSAIDRSAARFISSAIGNQGNGESAARAGKAITSFLGGVADTGASHIAQGSLMPSALPTTIMRPMHAHQTGQGQTGSMNMTMPGNVNANGINPHQMEEAWNRSMHEQPIMNHQNPNMPMPMQMGGQMNQMHHPHMMHQHQHQQMQMNMMHQQMAMMQMAQQQQQHLQQQQQQQQFNAQKELEKQQSQAEQLKQQAQAEVHQNQDVNDWHNHLDDEFQSYLNTYTNDIQSDAASTHEQSELGHEGYVEGASIERLAAAWEEAEREFSSTDDYANLAAGYDYEDETAHRHYEFSQASELHGQRQDLGQSQEQPVDLMAEGMRHFEEGNTSEAILCFESELRNLDMDNSDAWLMLGKCHAENDEDRKAIICLENAVERDPYSSEALLALGVSYVNELDHERALKHLNNWVTHNPNYAGLKMSAEIEGGEEGALLKLKSLLNQAKQYDEANGNVENSVDVLEALGVVCNVTREYDEAVECFRSAARMRPNDYQLWNKLGATLANSSRSDEAQDAYQNALSIKPKYARSFLNMAISHSNLQNHDEAARCYLQTLSLNPGAVHVWSYLRIALTCSERWDLLPLAASQDLNAFQQHFDFVQY